MNNIIYIIRHGETTWNKEGRKQGRQDSPLTLKGIDQALKTSDVLAGQIKNINTFTLVSSPQKRCRQSASIICEKLKIDFACCIFEKGLMEHCFGLWEGKTESEIEKEYPKMLEKRRLDWWNFIVPMGESYKLLFMRTKKVFNKYKTTNTIIICHEMVSKTLRGNYLNLSPNETTSLTHPQDTIQKLQNGKTTEIKLPIESQQLTTMRENKNNQSTEHENPKDRK